jgi:hypothetical protein
MQHYDWTEKFRQCFDKAVKLYQQGNRDSATFFNADETAFLASIGHTAQELYDFAGDFCRYNEPSFPDAVLIAAVRRDYFLVVQNRKSTGKTITMESLPAKEAEVAGFAWLPRIIAKARAKLQGQMPADLMYGCGGDRKFLQSVDVHPADFLRVVWWAGDDDQKVIGYVQQCAAQSVF